MTARKLLSEHTPTPEVASKRVLQRTIVKLVNQAIAEKTTSSFYILGRCLLLIGDELNSYFAFQQRVSVFCYRCTSGEIIIGNRYTCRSCVDTDLCEHCFKVFREDEKFWRCQSHDFVQVPQNESKDTLPEKDWLGWLSRMRDQYARKRLARMVIQNA